MKLTLSNKNAIINSTMADIPRIDYGIQIDKRMAEIALEFATPAVRAVYAESPELFKQVSFYNSRVGYSVYFPLLGDNDKIVSAIRNSQKVAELDLKKCEQTDKIHRVKRELNNSLKGITTDTAFRKAYPEFAKYCPTEEKTKNLPSIRADSVVATVVAAGWTGEE